MNKIKGLQELKNMGLATVNYVIYSDGFKYELLNGMRKYLIRKSLKSNCSQTSLGALRNLSVFELEKYVTKIKNNYDLIIQEEVKIDFYGSASRFKNGIYDILWIELYKSLEDRNSGKVSDKLICTIDSDDNYKFMYLPKNNIMKHILYDVRKFVVYNQYEIEFIISGKNIYYTDFDTKEKENIYEKRYLKKNS